MPKKKTLPKTLKQKAVSLFKNEKEEKSDYTDLDIDDFPF